MLLQNQKVFLNLKDGLIQEDFIKFLSTFTHLCSWMKQFSFAKCLKILAYIKLTFVLKFVLQVNTIITLFLHKFSLASQFQLFLSLLNSVCEQKNSLLLAHNCQSNLRTKLIESQQQCQQPTATFIHKPNSFTISILPLVFSCHYS